MVFQVWAAQTVRKATAQALACALFQLAFPLTLVLRFHRSGGGFSRSGRAVIKRKAIDNLGFYELSCHLRSTSTLSAMPESSGWFDCVYPLSCGSSDSDLELVNESPRRSREASAQVSPTHKSGSLHPMHINDAAHLISARFPLILECALYNEDCKDPRGAHF